MTARAASGTYVCARVSAIRRPHTTKLPCRATPWGSPLAGWLIFTVVPGNPVALCRTSRSTFAEISTVAPRQPRPGHTAPDQTHRYRYRAGAAAAVADEDAVARLWIRGEEGDVSVCGAQGVGRCCVEGVVAGVCVCVGVVGHRRTGPRRWLGTYLLPISEWFGSDVVSTC